MSVSSAQLAANRSNAQSSTGPRTEEGKRRSSANALRTGLTGRTVLLPGDDLEAYTALRDQLLARFSPETADERDLVQRIVDGEWRLRRIPELIDGIYLLGAREIADDFKNEDEALRAGLIRTRVYLNYRRELDNIALQESRLRRAVDKDTAALEALQQPRLEKQRRDLQYAVKAHEECGRQSFDRAYWNANGFVFSEDAWNQAHLRFHINRTRPQNHAIAEVEFKSALKSASAA